LQKKSWRCAGQATRLTATPEANFADLKVGEKLSVEMFAAGQLVDVTGKFTKGKGFQALFPARAPFHPSLLTNQNHIMCQA
jgi:hypothetical protein